MSGHEARINDALKQLGEEFRLGMVAADDYRARRRALLESWGERDVTTSPGSLRRTTAPGPKPPPTRTDDTMATAAPARARPGGRRNVLLAGIGGLLLVAGAAYFWLAPAPKNAAAPNAAPAPPPASAQVIAVKNGAEAFLSRKVWEAGPINAFLDQWRRLTPPDRARAREEPAVRTLRHELEQNVQAESQLVAPDAPPEQRQRLDLLLEFARELDA